MKTLDTSTKLNLDKKTIAIIKKATDESIGDLKNPTTHQNTTRTITFKTEG